MGEPGPEYQFEQLSSVARVYRKNHPVWSKKPLNWSDNGRVLSIGEPRVEGRGTGLICSVIKPEKRTIFGKKRRKGGNGG